MKHLFNNRYRVSPRWPRIPSLLSYRLDDQRAGDRGATFVEFAMSIPVFLTMILSILDLARVSYQAVSLQFVLQRVARFAVVQSSIGTARFNDVQNYLIQEAGRYGIDLSAAQFQICPVEMSSSGSCTSASFASNPGDAEQFVLVNISKSLQLFFPNRSITVRANVVVKNEPF